MVKNSDNPELVQKFNALVAKIDKFIADYGSLDVESRSRRQESFNILVCKYAEERRKTSRVARNERETLTTEQDKTVERFKKYRKRVSENSMAQLQDFYNFLLTLKGQVVPAQKLLPEENHPLKSPILVKLLRRTSQHMDEYISEIKSPRSAR